MKKLFILATVFLLINICANSNANASSDRWVWIDSDDKRGVFFDTQSFQNKSKTYAKEQAYSVWIKLQYTEAYGKELANIYGLNESVSHELWHVEFNYENKTMLITSIITYGKNGNSLCSSNNLREINPIIPGSLGEVIFYATYSYYKNHINN